MEITYIIVVLAVIVSLAVGGLAISLYIRYILGFERDLEGLEMHSLMLWWNVHSIVLCECLREVTTNSIRSLNQGVDFFCSEAVGHCTCLWQSLPPNKNNQQSTIIFHILRLFCRNVSLLSNVVELL